MKQLSRISVFATLLLGLAVATQAGSFKEPVGLQLYSLRGEFLSKGVPATLEKVHNFGFKHVELAGTYNLPPEKFKQMLDANHLVPISGHNAFERYRDDVEGIAKDAKALGLKYAGCAWIPHKGDFDEAQCRAAIAVFNKAGEALAKHGIKFFYHVHGYEFLPHGDGTMFDLLVKETNPKFVSFQMDVFWVMFPGQDPVKLLEKHGHRWELMHLKDMKKGLKGNQSGGTSDLSNDVALGTGQMNWPAILKAAKKAGVKHYFIEDESPTVSDQIPVSLKYMESVSW